MQFVSPSDILILQIHNQVGELRTKQATALILQQIFTLKKTAQSATAAKKLMTKMGVKDVYQEYFTNHIACFMGNLPGSVRE